METAPEFTDQESEMIGTDTLEFNDQESKTENADIPEEEYDKTISGAANLLNYGLDGIARKIGVEQLMQAIKNYDPSNNLDNPIKGFYESVGIDTTKEYEDVHNTNSANRDSVNEYLSNTNMPSSSVNNVEYAVKALSDAHDLIRAVESSPEYTSLRESAKNAEMGYFQFAIHDIPNAGLVDLFGRLEEMKDGIQLEESIDENQNEDNTNEREINDKDKDKDKDENELYE